MSIDAIIERVKEFNVPRVTLTGGEPLAQDGAFELLTRLCDANLEVSLETSGAMDVACVDTRVMKVLDIKTPGSGEVKRNLWSNLEHLHGPDQVKFVICGRADYEWSRARISEVQINGDVEILFSPSHGAVKARELAEWILEDTLNVRLQVQLHKYLWGDVPGR